MHTAVHIHIYICILKTMYIYIYHHTPVLTPSDLDPFSLFPTSLGVGLGTFLQGTEQVEESYFTRGEKNTW